jgi:hypothetical protein
VLFRWPVLRRDIHFEAMKERHANNQLDAVEAEARNGITPLYRLSA